MYKSQLQELCQKKSWSLPVYDSVKDGSDHQPHFTATVTVNDATFESPIQCRSSKEAQSAAAQVAFNNFSSLPPAPQPQSMISLVQKYAPSGSLPSTTNLDTKIAKSGEVEQKKDGLLIVDIEEVDGNSFETPNHFSTLKDESMSLHLTEEDKVSYKTLLQEHAQRKGLRFPIYDTQRSGPLHTPLFVSRVEIGDKSFHGQEAKTKKMAEMNAAKAAYICLTKCSLASTTNLDTKTAKSGEVEQKKDGLLLVDIEEVDGNSFETPNHFSTLKDAEHGAAKVAFESMSLHLTEQDKVSYKTLLQEHAQRKGLRFPIYDTQRSGPLHTPLFVSRVEIGDKSFQGQEAKTKKMAEMNAAKAAYICLTKCSLPSTTNLDTKTARSGEVEQKKDGLLIVDIEEVLVTVDGNSFETPNHFSTLKDAEHGAAKVAFESMSLHLTVEDKVSYKTLLQEHAQRKGLRFPIYDTQRSGPVHMPLFVSRVEIGDKSFQGQEAKTKKMAEMNAAKAAYICLTKCQKSQYSNYSAGETSEVSSFNLQPNVTGKVEEAVARKSNSQSSNFSGGKTLEVSTLNLQPNVRGNVEDVARKNNIVSKEQAQEIQDNNAKRHRNSTTSEDAHARERGSSIAKSPPQDSKDGASLLTLNVIIPPAQASVKRILVSPHTPNMIIPEGATILPSSNDQWVAVAMTVPEEEYEKYYN